ncbi:MAG TPA: hypothetical protein VFH87_01810 [Candidatus Udaeobacter sp.]|nr:hypothetical protein [Candidatus Udaeobacter sp.]
MHEGRGKLIERLTWQVGGDREFALKILRKRGHVDEDGNLTEEGRMRDLMTAAEREIDRGDKPGSSNRTRK